MKNEVLLPFEYTPDVVAYHFVAFPLGIIQGNAKQSIIPWLSSRYINCRFSATFPCPFAYFDADDWAEDDKILFHRHINLHNEQFNALVDGSHTAFLKEMIQLGYYPHGLFNEEFIPGKKAFQSRYYEHDYIICGYDDNIGAFISAGYLSDDKFQRFSIPYECMERAVTTLHREEVIYHFWKYNQEATYPLNCQRISLQLNDYLQSTNSQPIYIQECTWGLDALLDTGEFIVDLCESKNYIEHRCTRAVMEHKKLMHIRISHLLSCNILDDQKYLDCACEVSRLSEISHLLGVKFRFTQDKRIAHRINDIYKRISVLESSYLPDVLVNIQRSIS